MIGSGFLRELNWNITPRQAMMAWHVDVPMLALVSGGDSDAFDRWTILSPRTDTTRIDARVGKPKDLMQFIRDLAPARAPAFIDGGRVRLPFAGGWIGFIGYECGAMFEPRGITLKRPSSDWPDAVLCHVPRALAYSHKHRRWFEVGDPDAAEVASLVHPKQGARRGWWAIDGDHLRPIDVEGNFERMVARAVEYVHAGDIFQANITQPFRATIRGCARHFALDALTTTASRYGAYLELDESRSLLSFSPELFLDLDGGTRRVTTRPMKGTRPDPADAHELMASEKDTAELHMIVDLMRNDIGRVCEIGSVRVDKARTLENHPTVLQTVAEVSGTLAQQYDFADLFAACFPPGSVTGAPKVRAMQIIDELESVDRGPYCGAIGLASSCGSALFSVAIRTAQLTRTAQIAGNVHCPADPESWTIDYHAGCGIVAESDPATENLECIAKTRILRVALAADCSSPTTVAPRA